MWKKIWCPSNRKVLVLNIAASLLLTVFLEYMGRKTFSDLALFMENRTFVFLYNVFIIFVTFSLVFLVSKKYFAFGIIFFCWGMIGLVNGIITDSRKTPFTAVDLTIFKSTIPVITSYFSLWQIVLAVVLLILAIAGLVTLFLYCPNARKSFDYKTNLVLVGMLLALFAATTYYAVGKGMLISRFDNLMAGYKDYGSAYSFVATAIDTGIDRPVDYSRNRVEKVKDTMDRRLKKRTPQGEVTRTPNIIFIQLESMFDITELEGIKLSQDPLPNLHRLQEETTGGYLTVPVYGAGTINTEFEVITGMNTSFFGTGEYPYRSILHRRTSESAATWLKGLGYTSTVIHNNNASFYDRNKVLSNLGFDCFISSENMNITRTNAAGWARDAVLEEYILDTMERTPGPDYLYAISVQGHGDYPDKPVENPTITVENPEYSEGYRNTLTYYVNQIYEMDRFIGNLTDSLSGLDENTILVFYGDHLPSLNIESKDLASGSKYKTSYIIWDNYGYNSNRRKEESGNLRAYQLSSSVFSQLGIHTGVMNEYHQVMGESKNYKRNMKLLQYDLLYGSSFSREGEEPLTASDIKYSMREVKVEKLKKNKNHVYVMGNFFTDYSRVYINGKPVKTVKLSDFALMIPLKSLDDGDELVVHQVNKTHPNITLNTSNTLVVDTGAIQSIYKEETP